MLSTSSSVLSPPSLISLAPSLLPYSLLWGSDLGVAGGEECVGFEAEDGCNGAHGVLVVV